MTDHTLNPTADGPASTRPTDPSGPTGRLASWLAGISHDDIPPEVRTRAAHLMLDGLGCGLVGAQLPWSRTAMAALTSVEPAGTHTLIGWDRKVSGQAAAVLNGTFIQGFELDDYHPRAPLHSCAVILPSLLATAEDVGDVTGRDLLTAAVVGFETGPRAGLVLHGGEMLSRGWHSGSVFGTHASAVAAGHLRRLDAAQTEDALGLAGTQSGGLMAAQYEAMSKRMHHGFAARAGYQAATLAAHGYTGIKRVFEREYGGWGSTFGEGHNPDPSQVSSELGERWETGNIAVKAHASMAGLHAAIDGTLQARSDGLSADDVERIDVSVSDTVYHHGWWRPERPLTAIGAQMNIGYAIAAALTDGVVLGAQFAADKLDDDAIWRLLDRTEVRLDESFQTEAGPGRYTTDLLFTKKDGTSIERRVLSPRGGIDHPLSNDDIQAKYAALTESVMPAGRRKKIQSLVLDLDGNNSVEELVRILSGTVNSVLA